MDDWNHILRDTPLIPKTYGLFMLADIDLTKSSWFPHHGNLIQTQDISETMQNWLTFTQK